MTQQTGARQTPALRKKTEEEAMPATGPRFDAAQLTALKRVGQIALSLDGDWVAVAVQRLNAERVKYVSDLWRVPLRDRTKHDLSALKFNRHPLRHGDHWLADGIDTPVPHLIVHVQDGSNRRDLTPNASREYLIEPGLDVSRDGRHAAITSARIGADRIDDLALELFDLDAGTSRFIAEAPFTEFEHPVFAPDGKRLACTATPRSRERV